MGAEINVHQGRKMGRLFKVVAPLSFQLVTRKGSGADEGPLCLGRKSVITWAVIKFKKNLVLDCYLCCRSWNDGKQLGLADDGFLVVEVICSQWL